MIHAAVIKDSGAHQYEITGRVGQGIENLRVVLRNECHFGIGNTGHVAGNETSGLGRETVMFEKPVGIDNQRVNDSDFLHTAQHVFHQHQA